MDIEQTPKSKNDITHSNTIVYMGEENKEQQNKNENEIKDDKTNEEKSNIRLDRAVTLLNPNLSRMTIQRLIDTENIKVNEKITKASYKTRIDDKITIVREDRKSTRLNSSH